nr:MAG TPA: Protein of unknown function (DUF1642) [Caudoviricetes sp.]
MNKDKVYLKGYVIGRAVDTLGYEGLMVQLENLDVVEIDKNLVHRDINEPQKVPVPQFVADWYEENKDDFETNLFQLIESLEVAPCEEDDLIDFIGWLIDKDTKPFQTLVNMHQFGYEVEEEKRYTVKMRTTNQPLFYNSLEKKLFFSLGELATQFTFKQLEEAGFCWVFSCPGIEIEEVDDE